MSAPVCRLGSISLTCLDLLQVDASLDGALLLEMYSDSGAGTTVCPDFFEVRVLLRSGVQHAG